MRVSRPSVLLHAALAAAGVALGVVTYATRSSTPAVNHPADNLIGVHVVIAVVAAVALAASTWLARRSGRRWLLARPVGVRAAARVRATLAPRQLVRPFGLLRAVVGLVLLALVLWEPLRSAMQPVAALDPHFRADAWGGPTYAGATLAHWLDAAVLYYAAAGLLHLVLVPTPSFLHSTGASAKHDAGTLDTRVTTI